MNFFDGLAFIFEDTPRANKMRRLCQAKLVVQDAWLEAGGCEICRGFGKLLDGRRCEHEFDLGLDPMLSFQEIIHRLTNTGHSSGMVVALPQCSVGPNDTITATVRPFQTFKPRKLLSDGNIDGVYVSGLFFGASNQIPASMSNPVPLTMYVNDIWKFDVVEAGLDISIQLENRSGEHRNFTLALAGDTIRRRPRLIPGVTDPFLSAEERDDWMNSRE